MKSSARDKKLETLNNAINSALEKRGIGDEVSMREGFDLCIFSGHVSESYLSFHDKTYGETRRKIREATKGMTREERSPIAKRMEDEHCAELDKLELIAMSIIRTLLKQKRFAGLTLHKRPNRRVKVR